MYLKKIKIGDLELKNNIFLAPMAGITDLPFRRIAEKIGGPGLVYTEMVSAKAIFYHDDKTKKLLNRKDEKSSIAVQLFGSDIESMVYAAKYVEDIADIIDINMGCPAPKVVKNGDGSKLLLDLELAKAIVSEVVRNVKKPVTVKIRKGWNHSNIVAVEAAKKIEEAGAAAITIHGRTREEYYSGNVDLDIIKKVKENVKIPVIGNGDIMNLESATKMFSYTGVDGIMIGRAALGNPWIFKEVKEGLETGDQEKYIPSKTEKLNTILEHLKLEIEEKGEYTGIREMRKHLSAYTKNMPESSKFRETMNRIEEKDKLIEYIKIYFQKIDDKEKL